MCKYLAFYNGKQVELVAATSLAAHEAAVAQFKVAKSKRHMVSVMLVEDAGRQVTHTADF